MFWFNVHSYIVTSLLIILFQTNVLTRQVSINLTERNTTRKCEEFEWQCENNDCIPMENTCDGNVDCQDGSDETAKECSGIFCPEYAFRCQYGGCIAGYAKCNGKAECADQSDEDEFLCHKENESKLAERLQGDCREPFKMQCKSGECIDIIKRCDGSKDCPDGSDETVEFCREIKCPAYAFQCAYGACISGILVCNGVSNCHDDSDEAFSLCGCRKTNEASTSNTTHGSDRRKWESNNQFCELSKIPNADEHIVCKNREQIIECNDRMPKGTVVMLSEENKRSKGTTCTRSFVCSTWSNWIDRTNPNCKRFIDIGVECGLRYPERSMQNYGPLIDVRISESLSESDTTPWEVSIFRKARWDNIFEFLCFGTIISKKIVLTSASCMNDQPINADYDVVLGNFTQNYAKESKIGSILNSVLGINLTNKHQHGTNTFEGLAILVMRNAFEFSTNVQPICLEFKDFKTFAHDPCDLQAHNEGFSVKSALGFGAYDERLNKLNEPIHFLTGIVSSFKTNGEIHVINLEPFSKAIQDYLQNENKS